MTVTTVLITGASGEIGHGLIEHLAEQSGVRIVALDLHPMDEAMAAKCHRVVTGDILDAALIQSLSAAHDFDVIHHLAALLSTTSERQPTLAHKVNVEGTMNLLEMAIAQARLQEREIAFLYPSSVAVYGLPTLEAKRTAGKVVETEWLTPRTMYGTNKLYCELLGTYYSEHYRQLDADIVRGRVDFRGLRFPGLISAATVPTGGTSDYGPEMLHMAAQAKPYACFVREDARIPFMAMPDGVDALLKLAAAPAKLLTRRVYNIGAFAPSAGEILQFTRKDFPKADVTFKPDAKRQGIIDGWPEDVNDDAARKDWGWKPAFGMERAFSEYLIPAITKRYGK
jgi:nucleoside-diphosphate-sugar epimerase